MTTNLDETLDEKRIRLRRFIPHEQAEVATQGMDHVAIFAKDLEVTAEFYSNVMGMAVTSVTPNRDSLESTHMTVDMGNGMSFAFFDFPHVAGLQRKAPEGVGGIMHIALMVRAERRAEIVERLRQRGTKFQEIGGSLYLKDPNGLGIELMASG